MGLSVPNLISILRIILVPVTIWLIVSNELLLAFLVFVAAGISDAVDGFIAKRFNQTTELGAYLDPLADKLLLVSIYVALGFGELLAAWLVIMVVSRDVLIIGAFLLSWIIGHPVAIKPLKVSKVNTVAQIVLAATVLGGIGFGLDVDLLIQSLSYVVGILTIVSGAGYLWQWVRHMASDEPGVS